jgi:outer membrane autotransporter protein
MPIGRIGHGLPDVQGRLADNLLDGQFADLAPGLVLGLSGSLGYGKLDNAHGLGRIDTETASLGAYASYAFHSGLFLDASLGAGSAQGHSKVGLALGGAKRGDFDLSALSAGLRLGYGIDLGGASLTPSLGLDWLRLKQEALQERITAPSPLALANRFSGRSDDMVDIPVQLKLSGTIQAGSARVTPELRLGWTYRAMEPNEAMRVGFVGHDGTFPVKAMDNGRNYFTGGTGLKVEVNDKLGLYASYDLEKARQYSSHRAALGLGFQF